MTSPALELVGLRKTYVGGKTPAKEALKGIDLTIERGAFFGLLGPNGAGKSTLINILAGLVNKTSGVAKICGFDIEAQMRAARLSIGVVPQELVVDSFFTVREALEIHAGYYGVPKAQRRTEELIAAMGLGDKANVSSRRLSGGMRRRLLIAKALVHAPQVLILDEPTAGVDVELRQQLWDYVRMLNKQGTTVLLTTHYLEEAQELCDRVAIINHGQVIANEPTKQLLEKFDSKCLLVRPSAALSALPEGLQNVGAKLTEDGQISFQYQPSESAVGQLLAAVQQAGVSIADISTQEADLETVFRSLTR